MPKIVTSFAAIQRDEPVLTGDEIYPIVGTALMYQDVRLMFRALAGMKRHWNCLEKAERVVKEMGRGQVVLGSLLVVSSDNKSTYGYAFDPPLEFHAWVQTGNNIIDLSLPGVIEKGLSTYDKFGAYLVGRYPVILAGEPEPWMIYRPYSLL